MKINFQLLILGFTIFTLSFTQVEAQQWHQIEEENIKAKRSNLTREIIPKKFKTYTINIKRLRSSLEKSPNRFNNENTGSQKMSIPLADGTFEDFLV